MNKYARIIIDLKVKTVDRPFTYEIPENFKDKLDIGSIVYVPFGNKKYKGYCIGFSDECVTGIKAIDRVLEEDYYINPGLIKLAAWMCGYYNCLWSDALSAIVPNGVRSYFQKPRERIFVKYDTEGQGSRVKGQEQTTVGATLAVALKIRKSSKKYQILEYLKEQNIWIDFEVLQDKFGVNFSYLKSLIEKKYILTEKRKIGIYEGQGSRVKGQDEIQKVAAGFSLRDNLTLTPDQKEAILFSKKLLASGKPETLLLHGVTASGKTEIYLSIIEECLVRGKEAIVLVPEISLTPQNIKIFKERLGEEVAVLHSALSEKDRLGQWLRIATGRAKVVLGARSAIFAPFNNLGLIIIDEEHETSYKQENAPRYNAKKIAEKRSEFNNALLILGTATPSVESFYKTQHGEYKYFHLPARVLNKELPEVKLVDLKDKNEAPFNQTFSELLKNEISYSLINNEQIIIFLNRRGFNSFILCRECGYIYKCKNCNVSLTYHKPVNKLICHHCFYRENLPVKCAKCGSVKFKYGGIGTQKVEDELKQLFPCVNIVRMDRDTTTKAGAHEKILSDFSSKKAEILLGTQMITKGLDFPDVALVGVILADMSLNIPDFRASERTFQLLTQVAGRSGRGEKKGKVIIQTYSPAHFSINGAISQDYFKFYEEEIENRRETNYPPFCDIINCIVSAPSEQDVIALMEKFASDLRKAVKDLKDARPNLVFDILGPAPCPIFKIKNRFRWHTFIKCSDIKETNKIINKVLENYKIKKDVRFLIDADPVSLL